MFKFMPIAAALVLGQALVIATAASANVVPPFSFGNTVDTPWAIAPPPPENAGSAPSTLTLSDAGTGYIAGAVAPPPFVKTFVDSATEPSISMPGGVSVGTTLPPADTLYAVPAYQYAYAYVNGMPVLVDPATRQVVDVLS